MKKKAKVIALYLPQYHPMKENDEWWGKGYTEWTSVAKAKPLFHGHEQPKIPADLGFYDLRLSESRAEQAELAKRAGIDAFCYYHYWFNGRQIMNRPFDEVVSSGKPDFPFCLAWANHDWYNKGWINSSKKIELRPKLLIQQTYGGKEDNINHFYNLLPAFKDPRYYKIHGKLVFMIYAADKMPELQSFIKLWQDLSQKEGLPGFYFITHIDRIELFSNIDLFKEQGIDAVNLSYLHLPFRTRFNRLLDRSKGLSHLYDFWQSHIHFSPDIVQYKDAIKQLDSVVFERRDVIPTIIPNWDHTPRSGRFGKVYLNSSPELFGKHVRSVLERLSNKEVEDQLIFLKSWNEWGEGNYLEPDIKYGCQYIDMLACCLQEWNN